MCMRHESVYARGDMAFQPEAIERADTSFDV
jgi:hypothetical protein